MQLALDVVLLIGLASSEQQPSHIFHPGNGWYGRLTSQLILDEGCTVVPRFASAMMLSSSVVIGQHFNPCYCRVRSRKIINMHNGRVSVELGRGKSLICITVESMTSSIVITLGSSILMKCLGKSLLFKLPR